MADYLRLRVPGAAVFFTVCLAERGSTRLVDEVVRLRAAVRATMAERPFGILAWVGCPIICTRFGECRRRAAITRPDGV